MSKELSDVLGFARPCPIRIPRRVLPCLVMSALASSKPSFCVLSSLPSLLMSPTPWKRRGERGCNAQSEVFQPQDEPGSTPSVLLVGGLVLEAMASVVEQSRPVTPGG